eukprot:gb/GFBE01013458.1/.p1 GENE.gb/GFBE01013458.1/~~gb/GFBE01013458.1/.p1  ORF type:complete len:163 (+),score=46.54 gb/GFBE01013458.1/:1-489(+)
MADPAEEGDGLTEGERIKFTEAFNIWDRHEQGYIPWNPDFACLWRSIGMNPTESQIKQYISDNDTGTGHFELDTFLRLCETKEDGYRREHFIEAFKIFDKDGKGTITIPQLRYILLQLGDPLEEADADEFIAFADKNKEGNAAEIDYEDLVERLDDRDPKNL